MGRPKGSTNHTANGEPLRNSVDGEQLRAIIERIERVNAEISDLTGDRREIYAEIKAAGYDVATVRAIVKLRATEAGVRYEKAMLLSSYMAALGDFATTELGQAGADRLRDLATHVSEAAE